MKEPNGFGEFQLAALGIFATASMAMVGFFGAQMNDKLEKHGELIGKIDTRTEVMAVQLTNFGVSSKEDRVDAQTVKDRVERLERFCKVSR